MDKETLATIFVIVIILCIGMCFGALITSFNTINTLSHTRLKFVTAKAEELCKSNEGPHKVNFDMGSFTLYCNNGAKFEDIPIPTTEEIKKMESINGTKVSN